MKLKYSFEYIDMGEEIIAVPIGKKAEQVQGVLKLNREGREIIELLKNDIEEQDIVDSLSLKFDVDKESLECYVNKIVETLKTEGLVE